MLKHNTYTASANTNLQYYVSSQWKQTALYQSPLGLRSDLSLNNIPVFVCSLQQQVTTLRHPVQRQGQSKSASPPTRHPTKEGQLLNQKVQPSISEELMTCLIILTEVSKQNKIKPLREKNLNIFIAKCTKLLLWCKTDRNLQDIYKCTGAGGRLSRL